MTMRMLVLAAIAVPTMALAQSAPPKIGDQPLVQVKPAAPAGCKLVGTVKGIKLWAGDCVAAEQLRSSTADREPSSLPERASGAIPPGQKQ